MARPTRGAAAQKRRRLSLWSMRGYCELDGRLVESREEKRLIAELSEHVGRPSVTQRILIKRAARLLIMIGQLERRMIEANELATWAAARSARCTTRCA